MIRSLARLWRLTDLYRVTLGHLAARQVASRAHRLVHMRLLRALPPRAPAMQALPLPGARPFAMHAREVPASAQALLAGRFAFIGLPEVTMATVDWSAAPGGSLLWTYYLHYFGHCVDLAKAYLATRDARYAERATQLIRDWIEANPMVRGPGWHPYPLSRRLVSWCMVALALRDEPGFRAAWPAIAGALVQQTRFLLDHREYDVLGNHLLANLHALAWVALLFGDALPADLAVRLTAAREEFWTQFLAQTFADGSHEENTLSYQMIVAQDAFETLLAHEAYGRAVPDAVRGRLAAMFEHLATMLTPGGGLPMVNDTLLGYPMDARAFLAAGAVYFGRSDWRYLAADAELGYMAWLFGEAGSATWRTLEPVPPAGGSCHHRESGYVVLRDGWTSDSDYMVFDAGPVGPRHVMAHAHADALSFELHGAGGPLVIDPGVYEYKAGRWRMHFRSTAAHNTVAVDGQDQSEVWSSFRVARRAEAVVTSFDPAGEVSGTHDGYRRLRGRVGHVRRIVRRARGRWEVHDRLTSAAGTHAYEATFQLPPGATATTEPGGVRVRYAHGACARFGFEAPAGAHVTVEPGWVSYTWHDLRDAAAIKLRYSGAERDVVFVTTIEVAREAT